MMSEKLSITVPHAICSGMTVYHQCDYLARAAAGYLTSKFQTRGTMVYEFVPTVNRQILDFNRREARGSFWRNNVLETILRENIKWNLDVHSYPDNIDSFGVTNSDGNFMVPEVVILDSYITADHRFIDPVTSTGLSNYLYQSGITVKLLPGGENDITLELREHGVKCTLIEFNESLRDTRLGYICDVIVEYITYHLHDPLDLYYV